MEKYEIYSEILENGKEKIVNLNLNPVNLGKLLKKTPLFLAEQ